MNQERQEAIKRQIPEGAKVVYADWDSVMFFPPPDWTPPGWNDALKKTPKDLYKFPQSENPK
jgi:hypothetical protein